MDTLVLILFQQGQTGGGDLLASPWIPLFLSLLVIYFILLRPQQKKHRAQQQALSDLIANLKAGDKIITTSGIIATVTVVRDKSLLVRSADKSILEIVRSASAVAGLHSDDEKAAS